MSVDTRDMKDQDPKQSAYNAFMSSLKQMPVPEPVQEEEKTELSGLDLIEALVNGTVSMTDDEDITEVTDEDKTPEQTLETKTEEVAEKNEEETDASSKPAKDEEVQQEKAETDESIELSILEELVEGFSEELSPDDFAEEGQERQEERKPPQKKRTSFIALGSKSAANTEFALPVIEEDTSPLALYEKDEDAEQIVDVEDKVEEELDIPSADGPGGFFGVKAANGNQNTSQFVEEPFDPDNPFGFILDNQDVPLKLEKEEPVSPPAVPLEQLMEQRDDGMGLPGTLGRSYFEPEDVPHVAFQVSGPYIEDGIATMQLIPVRKIGGYAVESLVKAKVLKVTGASLFGTLEPDKAICSFEWDAYKGMLEASTAVAHGVGVLSEVAFANFGKEIWDRVARKGTEDRRYIESLEMDGDEDFTCMMPSMKVVNAVLDVEYFNLLWTLSLGRAEGIVEMSWDCSDNNREHRNLVKRASILFSGALYPFVLQPGQDGASNGKRSSASKLGKWAKDKMGKDGIEPFAIDAQGRVKPIRR